MAKTKEELNQLKSEFETLNNKLKELTKDELKKITGGEPGPTPTPCPEPTPSPTESDVGDSEIVARAISCLGQPYVFGAVGPNGYDDSGLVSYCISGAHSRIGTCEDFMNWPRVSNPKPGDICVNLCHCGIYVGGGQMIHAPTYGQNVCYSTVQSGMVFVKS